MGATGELERYRTISTLGAGGMARVDLAEDTRLGREVALKRITGESSQSGLTRLRREALVGASVSHPNLVSIFDVVGDVASGGVVIVMEYVAGETLRDRLNREGRLPAAEALRILEEVAAGLDAIHARGIVHRDVKPSNILLGEGGQVKVADLGIAAVPDQTRITTSGAIVGSLSYMAPEQLGDSLATPAIDIYALATVAWEMLSGAKARTAPNAVALAHEIANQASPDLREAWPEAPPAAARVLAEGMARDPSDRPATAGELVGRLRAALIEEPTQRLSRRTEAAPAAVAAMTAATASAASAAAAPAASAAEAGPVPPGRAAATPAAAAAPAPGTPATGGRPRPTARPARPTARPAAGRTPPPRPDQGRSHGGLIAGGLIALVAAAIAAAVLLSSQGSAPTRRAAATGVAAGSHHHRAAASAGASHSASTPAAGSATGSASSSGSSSTAASSSTTAAGSSTAGSSTAGTSSAAAGAPAGASGGSGSPAAAVRSFYELAAAHSYSSAWALGDSSLHSQVGGYNSFVAGQSGDRSIVFHTDRVISQSPTTASVAISTTSNRTDGTHQCQGSVDLVHGSGGWLVHLLHITGCT